MKDESYNISYLIRGKMTKKSQELKLTATPELEDFGHKYTEEGQGLIGAKLLDGYFAVVRDLIAQSDKLSSNKNIKAIELGCGVGYSTARLKAMLNENTKLFASEYVPALVPKAQELNPGVKVIEESVYELTHKDKTFDVVFLLEVLEHLDYPDKALAEINRVLKDDGVLILGVPHEPLWRILNMARGKYLKDFGNTVGHLNHWSARGLEKFVDEHFGPVISRKNPLPWTLVLARKR
jgi:SAM-dependent methyltransferase